MMIQYHRQHIFCHAGRHHRIGEANDWNIREPIGMTPELVHPRPGHDNGLQTLQLGKQSRFRRPDHGDLD